MWFESEKERCGGDYDLVVCTLCSISLQEIADTFHVNSEELVSYELPALAALHFSLLTPICQTFTHFEKLRDKDISTN